MSEASVSETICVGTIAGAFGVNGEVRLKSFTAEPEALAEYAPLTTEDSSRSFEVQITRPVKGGFAARLSGVRSKEEADALRGTGLYAPRDRLPTMDRLSKVNCSRNSFGRSSSGFTALTD